MNSPTISAGTAEDTELVSQSLAGSKDAFGHIVERYQSLVCALTFSGSGNMGRSEDLAQETFLTAWQQLKTLREPAKLRSWLCGIARNTVNSDLRRQGREPTHRAENLGEVVELPSPDALPSSQAITDEEAALLWREVGQLPEIYREPLVLFYREHQSVTRVAEALELSEDAVMQRLSRGRKLLHERMLTFVESALERTKPGRAFALDVQAALPLLAVGSQGAAFVSVKGAVAKYGVLTGAVGFLAFLAMPFIGALAALGVSWSHVRNAEEGSDRRFAKLWHLFLWVSIGGMMLGVYSVETLGRDYGWSLRAILAAHVSIWTVYLVALSTLLVLTYRRSAANLVRRQMTTPGGGVSIRWTAPLIGVYVASTAWLIGFTAMIYERGHAGVIAIFTIVLATWNILKVRGMPAASAHKINAICHALLCGFLLLLANWQVDRWVSDLYTIRIEEMRELLPMSAIHWLTVALVGWVGFLLVLTRNAWKPSGHSQVS